MRDFVFSIPTKVYFGPGQRRHLGEEVARWGTRCLVVTGGGSVKASGLFDEVSGELRSAGIEIFELTGVEPNPRIESVREGVRIARDNRCDVVLAVGGGSVIDAAKFVCAGAVTGRDPWDYFADKELPVEGALPLVCVLTIAATGSEMNPTGVISNLSQNRKLGRKAEALFPKASFMDPTLTYTVSAFQTASGAADILSHTLETYCSLDDDLFFLDTVMEGICRTVVRYAPMALEVPDDYEARANLMWASSWAINGFVTGGKTQRWSCHAIEHELSALYDITHGLGLAIVTPRWMAHVLDEETAPRLARLAREVFGIETADDGACARAGVNALAAFLYDALGLDDSLADLGIGEEHLAEMAEQAVGGPDGTIPGFKPLRAADVEAIYRASLGHWEPI